MKASEVHKMNDEELVVEAANIRKRIFDLRSQAVTEKLENPRRFGNMRRDIARLLTEKRQREMQHQTQGAA